jgi:hypothetical protein
MENKQKIKKIVFGLIIVVVLALISLNIYQNSKLTKLSQAANSLPVMENQTSGTALQVSGESQQKVVVATGEQAVQKIEHNANDDNNLKNQLDAAEKELDAANKKLSNEINKKAEKKKKEIELQKQMMKDPSYKNYMKTYLDTAFADIFKELSLSPEKLDNLKDLIVEYQMTFSEINLDSYSAYTDEEKTALKKRADKLYNDNQSKLKDLLGDADYQKYYDYAERSDARYNINSYMATLNQDEKLTKDQEKALVEILYKEQAKVFSEIGYDPNKTLEFVSDVKAGKVAGRSKNMEKIFTRSVESAKGLLSASQLEQFKNYLTDYKERMDLSYKSFGMED